MGEGGVAGVVVGEVSEKRGWNKRGGGVMRRGGSCRGSVVGAGIFYFFFVWDVWVGRARAVVGEEGVKGRWWWGGRWGWQMGVVSGMG